MSSTAIIGLTIFALCILAIYLVNRKQLSRKKQLLKLLHGAAETNKSKISEKYLWTNVAFALDTEAHRLFFARKKGAENVTSNINLAEISRCKVVSSNKTVVNDEGSFSIIDKIEISFQHLDNVHTQINIEFFDFSNDGSLSSEELHLVGKWVEIINKEIDRIKHH